MTDGPAPAVPGPLDINWSFGLAKRPDGKHWILISISTVMNNYQFNIPPDMAEQLADNLPKLLGQLVKDAKRLDLGLEVAATMPKQDVTKLLKGKK
jgi:hypothetical protein